MKSYVEMLEEHRRLSILRVLAEAAPHEANDSILTDALNAVGVTSSRDQARTAIGWLAEQGLVTQEALGSLKLVRLTGRGLDVARGRARVDGVKPPSPGS